MDSGESDTGRGTFADQSSPVYGAPLICGALGDPDPALVRALVSACGLALTPELEDVPEVAIYADRPGFRWGEPWVAAPGGAGASGLGWHESHQPVAPAPARWEEAACAGMFGIAREANGKPVLHSTVSGLMPLQWTQVGDATYFCTLVDPLLAVMPARLEPDLEALMMMLTLGIPLGDRTMFTAIRRLPQMAMVGHAGAAGARVTAERWPWAEAPVQTVESAGEQILAVLDDYHQALALEPGLRVPLSGGWDSRVLAAMAVRHRARPDTWTVNTDKGNNREERYAAGLAEYLGLDHKTVPMAGGAFERDYRWVADRQQYMGLPHLPFARMVHAMSPGPGTIVDGIGGGPLLQGMIEYPGLDARLPLQAGILPQFWKRFTDDEAGHATFDPALWELMMDSARSYAVEQAAPFEGHPSAFMLFTWTQRIRRYISYSALFITSSLGPVATPLVSDGVARAALGVPLPDNSAGEVYKHLFGLIDPELLRLPSTHNSKGKANAGSEERVPRLRKAPEAIEFYERVLAVHPMRESFAPELREALAGGTLRRWLRGGIRNRMMEQLVMTGLWWERYSSRLPEISANSLR